LVVYLIIFKVLYIPSGAGFLPSTVLITDLECRLVFLIQNTHPAHEKDLLEASNTAGYYYEA